MAEVGYAEHIFTTDNKQLAAVCLTFGAPIRKNLPLEWVDEYPSKDAYIASLYPGSTVKPKRIITFNFVTEGVNVEAIAQSFYSEAAQDKFVELVRGSGLDPKRIEKILQAHSLALGSACREALAAWEYVLERERRFPDGAKWIQVRGKGRGEVVRFGYGTSKEMREDLLSKID